MKFAAVLLSVCCCLSAVSGQWLEATVFIPDSFGGIGRPRCLAYDPAENRVFVGGASGGILVLDAKDGRRLGRVPLEGNVASCCYNPVENKVYASLWSPAPGSIKVIDAKTLEPIATVEGYLPTALAFSATSNKVYCANNYRDDVTVIDGGGDSVVATVPVGRSPDALCWNPDRNVVYVANDYGNTVTVIDVALDSVVATIPVGDGPTGLVYNPNLNKLYTADYFSSAVTVIDGLADTVLATINCGDRPVRLCYNPVNGKVFAAGEDEYVLVIDCAGDSLLGQIEVGGTNDVAYNPMNNRVYAAGGGAIAVIDGATDKVLSRVDFGDYESVVCVADSGRRAFGTMSGISRVGVMDCATDSMLMIACTEERPRWLCFNSSSNKVYCADDEGDKVTVIDGSTNVISADVPVPPLPVALLHNPVGNKVYCASRGYDDIPASLTVIDGNTDSVLKTIVPATGPKSGACACLNTTDNRVYVGYRGDASIVVVDAVSDSVLGRVLLDVYPLLLCHGPAYNYVYVATDAASVSVIDAELNLMIADVEVGHALTALCYNPVGARVYAASSNDGKVRVIAGERPQVVAEIGVGGSPSALCLDTADNKVFCADQQGRVAVIDAGADTVVARLTVGQHVGALAYDSVNDYVYCACPGSNDVYVIDAHRDSVVGSVGVGAEPIALAWNPIELRTYVANHSGFSVSVIRDSLHVGVTETMNDERGTMNSRPTIIRGILFLPSSLLPLHSSLLSADGRKMMELRSGANDVSRLAPGVYFIREGPQASSHRLQAVRKVVIAR